jgi:hypothetical protein
MLAKNNSTTIILNVIVAREHYLLKTNQHVLNEHLSVSRGKKICVIITSYMYYGREKNKLV